MPQTQGLTIKENTALAPLCTFGIGGSARYSVKAETIEDIKAATSFARQRQLHYLILGKGSNVLFDDRGFDGLVILNRLDFVEDEGDGLFYAGAGYSFPRLGQLSARRGWTGLEFAAGIPASVGGAVFMNAGAGGQETADCLSSVLYLSENGECEEVERKQLDFAYRHSPFQNSQQIILAARFQLQPGAHAQQDQKQRLNYRLETQPYGDKSAGCVFRNPSSASQGCSAGALIEAAGLKGFCIGGAQVSPKHANFIVNTGSASCSDVLTLIKHIQEKVHVHSGIDLACEIRYIPYTQHD